MDQQEMIALVEQHLKAEGAGDVEGAVAVYTDDVLHDAVGFPGSPRTGKDAAREFYRFLSANFRTEGEQPLNRFFDGDNMILEQDMTGAVIGEMLGIPGHGRKVTFRILHVFGFDDGLISREQVWVDGAAIAAQLTAP
ncbi:MAG TPA: nuclear transport factor 2 family protein [Acidimicrobiales bacterium]|nr:nuclear transport factor 2 family protein [Acidimicrobiales bacterium]